MGLDDYKISNWKSPVTSLADRPKMTAANLKAAFDSNSNELKEAHNKLIEYLKDPAAMAEMTLTINGQKLNVQEFAKKVVENLNQLGYNVSTVQKETIKHAEKLNEILGDSFLNDNTGKIVITHPDDKTDYARTLKQLIQQLFDGGYDNYTEIERNKEILFAVDDRVKKVEESATFSENSVKGLAAIADDHETCIEQIKEDLGKTSEQLNNIQIDKLTVYTSSVVNGNEDIFDGSVTNITDGSNVIGGDFIGKITGEIVNWFSCRLTIVNTGFQDFRKKHSKIKIALKCSAQTNLIVCATPDTSTFTGGGIWNSYINFNDKSVRIISIDLSGDEYNDIDRLCIQFILSCNNSTLYVTNTIGEYKASYFIFDEDINFLSPKSSKCVEAEYADYSCEAKRSEDSTRFAGHTENEFKKYKNFIVYYGDSLTMYGGWTQIVEQKSGMTGYNFGIGGEDVPTIACRAGGDSMIVPAGVTIGKSASIVPIADKNGIGTLLGYKAFPNRNGSTNDLGKLVNPIYIGESRQPFLLYRSGSGDTESWGVAACDENLNIVSLSNPFVINSPMLIRCSKNTEEYQSPKILFVFIGTNSGGYKTLDEYIMFNKLIQNHIGAQHTVFLGMTIGSSSGYFPTGQTITTYSDYYQRMKVEFGTSFIDLHDYLMKYGLIDAGMTPTSSDDEAISAGKIPTSFTTDGVHYTSTAKQLIGNYIYRRCCEINVF